MHVAHMMVRMDMACGTSCGCPGHAMMMSEMAGHRAHCLTFQTTARE